VARQKQHEDIDHDISLVWMTEALHRQKRLKPLKSLLAKHEASGKSVVQTPRQARAVLSALGFKARPLSEEAKKATKLVIQ